MLTRCIPVFSVVCVFACVAAPTALGQAVPPSISYQGKLTDSTGNPVADRSYSVLFKLYDVLSGGSAFWTGDAQTVITVGGVFTAAIQGGTPPFGPSVLSDKPDAWLETIVGTETLSPRVKLLAVPYALVSGSGASAGWSLTGNSGTTPGTNFIGTTDSVALELKVNSLRALRIEPNSTSPNLIGGHSWNSVSAGLYGCTISGGGGTYANTVTGPYGTISGGRGNNAYWEATVGGGDANDAAGDAATVGGGVYNTASGSTATVGGGYYNRAAGAYSTIAGGQINVTGDPAYPNTIGNSATVPGGAYNSANGNFSFAAGYRAKAGFEGSFVWADKRNEDFYAQAINQFRVRATGGVEFVSGLAPTTGVWLPAGGSGWSPSSDRNLKANFALVDGRAILGKLAAMPVQSWNLKTQDPSIRHMGPMAQDFAAAFGVGEDDRHISTIDADGVALAAIQGLYKIVQDKESRISSLETENAGRQKQITDLQKRMAELEKMVNSLAKAK